MSALTLGRRTRTPSCGARPATLYSVTYRCVVRGGPILDTFYFSGPSRMKRNSKRSAPTCCTGLGRLSNCINHVISTVGRTNVCRGDVVVIATSRKKVGGKRNKGAVRRVRAPFVVTKGGVGGKKTFRRDVVRFSYTSAVTSIFGLRRPRI